MNLHDWIDEVCDVLDLDVELDEALVLDVARDAAHNVVRPAAPITTYLLGYAAALQGGRPERTEELAAAVTALAEAWGGDKPAAEESDEDLAAIESLDETLVEAD